MIQYPMAPTPERVRQELAQAREELASARVLLEGDHLNAAISSCYYACFHAARAVLYHHGATPATHKGVVVEFSRRFVKPGWLERQWSAVLEEMRHERELADYHAYSRSIAADEVRQLVASTERFVGKMAEIIQSGEKYPGDAGHA